MNTTKPIKFLPESLRVGDSKRLWQVIRLMKSGTLLRGASLNKYEDKDKAISYAREIASNPDVVRVWLLLVETKVLKQIEI
jgi:hypothetical protein